MKKKNKNKFRFFYRSLLASAVFIGIIFSIKTVQASTISPLRQSIVINPGHEEVVEVSILNNDSSVKEFIPEVDSFKIDPDKGYPIFGQHDKAINWIKAHPQKLSINPGEKKEIVFTISVPAYAEPVAHYLGLFAREASQAGQVSAQPRVGSLLFLYIAGEMHEDVSRTDFSSSKKLYLEDNILVNLSLKNNGTIHAIPKGFIEVNNAFGKQIKTLVLNEDERKILPHDNWNEEYTINQLTWKDAGPIKINAKINYGIKNKLISDSITIWYLPAEILIIIGALISAIIMLAILWRIKKSKSKAQKVI